MSFDSRSDRRLRARHGRRQYKELDPSIQEEVEQLDTARSFSVEQKLTSDKFDDSFVKWMNGNELNVEFVRKNGFFTPLVFKERSGLGIRTPPDSFTVNDVKQFVGDKRIVDVMDVSSQQALEMFMDDWVDYYTAPERDLLLNVISLEFSHTAMEHMVQSPRLVRDLDWVDMCWPSDLKKAQKEGTNDMASMMYPKVQKYCLMSVGGCYTDFHIDFGGTSVWYHLIRGEKVFWLIPPTPENLAIYEKWVKSGRQQDIFLGDVVEKCGRVHLYAGYTFMIPTGWIHAVYTPCDSLVFGGNFLHSFNIEGQLVVSDIEDRTKVPHKFRYPFFVEILWHVIDYYTSQLESCGRVNDFEQQAADKLAVIVDGESVYPTEVNELSMYEIRGLLSLVAKMERSPTWKRRAPIGIGDPNHLLAKLKEQLNGYKIPFTYMSSVWKDERVRSGSAELMSQTDANGGTDSLHADMSCPDPQLYGDHNYWKTPESTIRLSVQKRPRIARYIESDELDVDYDWMDSELMPLSTQRQHLTQFDRGCEDDDYTPQERERPHVQRSSSNTATKKYKRKHRCGNCAGCLACECKKCRFCLDMPKYGGTGRLRQACVKRKCVAMIGGNSQSESSHVKSSSSPSSNSQRQKHSTGSRARGVRATSSSQAAKRMKRETEPAETDGDEWPVPDASHSEECVSAPYPGLGLTKIASLEGDSDLFPDSVITPLELDEGELGIIMSDVCGLTPDDIQLGEVTDVVNSQPETAASGVSGLMAESEWKSKQMASKQVQDLLEGRGSSHREMHSKKIKRKKKPLATSELLPRPKGMVTDSKVSEDPVLQMAEANRVKSSFKIPKRCDGRAGPTGFSRPSRGVGKPPPLISLQPPARLPSHFSHGDSYRAVAQQPPCLHRPAQAIKCHLQQQGRSERTECDSKQDSRKPSVGDSYTNFSETARLPQMKSVAAAGGVLAIDPELEISGLDRKQWLLIFRCLSQSDVCSCMLVCQAFYTWAQDPCLWHSLNLSRVETITAAMLSGIRKRQPRALDLSWSGVTQRQLRWLLNKLTLLNELHLTGCSKAILPALVDCKPFPPVRVLDLGWVEGLSDQLVQGILAAPHPSSEKPTSVKQLRSLQELRLTGSCITDATLQFLSRHSACLVKLDCSYCSSLTDRAIEWLTSVGSPSRNTLQDIDLSGCSKLTDKCIPYFARCSQLCWLDLRLCEEVTIRGCGRFVASSHLPLILKDDKLIERSGRSHAMHPV